MDGCEKCSSFLEQILPQDRKLKIGKSVAVDLREAIEELFEALGLDHIMMEGDQSVPVRSFIKDFIKTVDEVKDVKDIVELWHIDQVIAQNLFMLLREVVFGEVEACETFEDTSDDGLEVDSDEFDEFSDIETE